MHTTVLALCNLNDPLISMVLVADSGELSSDVTALLRG